MPKAYSYVRFSTPEQAKGDSLRRQLERSKKYADEHGLVLDTSFDLLDQGLSGYTTGQTHLNSGFFAGFEGFVLFLRFCGAG